MWASSGPNVDFLYVRGATDHNIDNTTAMLHEWMSGVEHLYHSVHLQTVEKEDRWKHMTLHYISKHYIFITILLELTILSAISNIKHNVFQNWHIFTKGDPFCVCVKHSVLVQYICSYVDELGPKHWPESRFTHVMKLRQAALAAARAQWADYILVRPPLLLYWF